MMYQAKLKKTHFSTSIEGNVLSIDQVEKVIKSKDEGNRLNVEQEVKNYWDALTFLEEEYQKKRKISLELILDLHDIIQKKVTKKRIGFREPTPPGILFAVYDSATRNIEYIPPESRDVIPLMNNMIEWYDSNQHIPAVIKAAIMHYALVTIHPFDDGNGRTARALATYILMLEEYDFKGFNSFEEYYMSDLKGYYSSLQMDLPPLFYEGRNNPPKLEIWIDYFCQNMALNSENIYNQALEASQKDKFSPLKGLTKKDLVLIRYCLENNKTIIKNKELSKLYGVTIRAISKWAAEWVNKGILEPASGKERITSYQLTKKYESLKLSELGFID